MEEMGAGTLILKMDYSQEQSEKEPKSIVEVPLSISMCLSKPQKSYYSS
jgi:hypothetical protein